MSAGMLPSIWETSQLVATISPILIQYHPILSIHFLLFPKASEIYDRLSYVWGFKPLAFIPTQYNTKLPRPVRNQS